MKKVGKDFSKFEHSPVVYVKDINGEFHKVMIINNISKYFIDMILITNDINKEITIL